jgi:two-component system NtrC family sensor kinase
MQTMQKDLTVSGLIHDLNNVFQTLVEAADRLSDDPQWNQLSQVIFRSVERGQRISLSLQSVESPGAPFESILDDAIAFVEDARPATRWPLIRFERNVVGDIGLRRNWAWERVLINLFLNAAQAMPDGGTIEVEAQPSGSDFLIVVRDTGTGIAPQLLDQLFKPHISTKPHGGMGLHVVETIIQQDGGTVQARNREDGPGAEFLITVPMAIAGMPKTLAAACGAAGLAGCSSPA